ncbi:hypothetical protein TSOC_001408 [Tetrabaena socialis]|uniref:F-box domain-containing protein n=1 Tax=Tetrabaena socialis TaxID=47790 RepID=A0A2J8AGW5_9CHLO|nr:hypothetical protein TSOC_001408 [Tetrabaena socialis]|eukprot:PNH11736.1 hypothetical protein TSOC_001408 [Tetrabaena socialis]
MLRGQPFFPCLQESRSAGDRFVTLPSELQLRVLEQVQGSDLCAVEAVCRDLRQLIGKNSHVYQSALSKEFGAAPPLVEDSSSWKAAYVQTVVQARLDALEGQRGVYNTLKLRLAELDDLLEQADEVKAMLGSPEMGLNIVMDTFVGDMEQDVLQQRWDTSEELMTAEADMQMLQSDVTTLLARLPRCWRQVAIA